MSTLAIVGIVLGICLLLVFLIKFRLLSFILDILACILDGGNTSGGGSSNSGFGGGESGGGGSSSDW